MGRSRAADRDLDGIRRAAVLSRPRRGQFSADASLEETAALLWDVPELPMPSQMLPVGAGCRRSKRRFRCWRVPLMASDPTQGRARASLVTEAAMLLRSQAAALGADLTGNASIAEGFARAWHCDAQRRRGDPRRAGADGRSRAQRVDFRRAGHGIDRRASRRRCAVGAGHTARPGAWRRQPAGPRAG